MRPSVGDSLEEMREMDLPRILAHVARTRREGSGVSCWLVWRTVSTGVREAPCRVQMVALAGEARARAEQVGPPPLEPMLRVARLKAQGLRLQWARVSH